MGLLLSVTAGVRGRRSGATADLSFAALILLSLCFSFCSMTWVTVFPVSIIPSELTSCIISKWKITFLAGSHVFPATHVLE